MRSYDQYCPLAKALDVVGDRWTLLIVRELLTQGPARYTDIRDGLPGIATNLLADRLRDLEAAGVLRRRELAPPAAATVFELTERGRALEPAMTELATWGAPRMAGGVGGASFRHHWLALPARHFLTDTRPDRAAQTVRVGSGLDSVAVTASAGDVSVAPGRDGEAAVDATIDGPPPVLVAVLAGRLPLTAALRAGLTLSGDVEAVSRVLPDQSEHARPG